MLPNGPGIPCQEETSSAGRAAPALWSTPFEAAHLAGLAHDAGVLSQQALTMWDGEEPLCCFGISSPWPGLGFAWCAERDPVAMDVHGRRVGLAIVRQWRQWLREGGYQRIESRAPQSHAAAQRLLRWLGFAASAVKPHYGPDDRTVVEFVYYP